MKIRELTDGGNSRDGACVGRLEQMRASGVFTTLTVYICHTLLYHSTITTTITTSPSFPPSPPLSLHHSHPPSPTLSLHHRHSHHHHHYHYITITPTITTTITTSLTPTITTPYKMDTHTCTHVYSVVQSSAALQYRIGDLQQRELISLTKRAELETKYVHQSLYSINPFDTIMHAYHFDHLHIFSPFH